MTTLSGDHSGQYTWIQYQQFECILENVPLLAFLSARKSLELADGERDQIIKEPKYTEVSTALTSVQKKGRLDQTSCFNCSK